MSLNTSSPCKSLVEDSVYISTRGKASERNFADVLLSGTAEDGGLYVPKSVTPFSTNELDELYECSYEQLCCQILQKFAGHSIKADDIVSSVRKALSSFRHAAVAPLKQLGETSWIMELFHGPTYAFKDYALQVVMSLINRELTVRGQHATILCATSGDTGSAAIHAAIGCDNIRLVVLHPHNRISPVQRRQMTTVKTDNILNIALTGDFDDCQTIVKKMFTTSHLKNTQTSNNIMIAVNSINWARIVVQSTYYAWAVMKLGGKHKVNFAIPSGNFGNAISGKIADRLGFPIGVCAVSSNENDVLTRMFETGKMEKKATVDTISPSMDIQIPSNFERFLYNINGLNGSLIAENQKNLEDTGAYSISEEERIALNKLFLSTRCSTHEAIAEIQKTFEESGEVICPHTATARFAARKFAGQAKGNFVSLATAHPAKFPRAIDMAIPSISSSLTPTVFKDHEKMSEQFDILDADFHVVEERINQFIQN